jgi:alkyl hydroperoxide reductase subunit F
VEDYKVIRGLEVVRKFKSELEYLDFARHMEPVEKIEKFNGNFVVHTKGGGELNARAVIIATGTKQLLIRVPGEKEYMMRGLCYSALSYAPLFIDRTTTVVGDRDLAMRSTAELSLIAQKVYLVCGKENDLDSALGKKLAQAENVEIKEGYEVQEVIGDEFARKLIIKGENGETEEIESDAFFIEKALIPNSKMVEGLVEMDDQGRIIVDCSNKTNTPGIYAAGDVTSGFAEQVLIAVGEGAKAALSAYDYLLPDL